MADKETQHKSPYVGPVFGEPSLLEEWQAWEQKQLKTKGVKQ